MGKPKGYKEINNAFLENARKQQKQQEAAHRLAELMRALASPPEGFLELLGRLEVPWIIQTLPFDEAGEYDCVVIRMKDLEAGEERNQAQGSQLQRMYAEANKQVPEIFVPKDDETQ